MRTKTRLLHHRDPPLLLDQIPQGSELGPGFTATWLLASNEPGRYQYQVNIRNNHTHGPQADCISSHCYNNTFHMLQRLEGTPSLRNRHLQGHAGHDLAERRAQKLEALPNQRYRKETPSYSAACASCFGALH